MTVANAFFTAKSTSGGTRVALAPTAAANASAQTILPLIAPRGLNVCVALSGQWGDANSDGAVNIIDAQQIARFSVALSVADANALQRRGDVTNDAAVTTSSTRSRSRGSVSP